MDYPDLKPIAEALSEPGTLDEQRQRLLSGKGWRFDGIFKPAPDNAGVALGYIYPIINDPTNMATRYIGGKNEEVFYVRLVRHADGKYVLQPPIGPERR